MQHAPPDWFGRAYGRHPAGAWEEARLQCRDLLVQWARTEHVGTYGDVAATVVAVTWPEGDAFRGQIGWLLGQVSYQELLEDRPLFSALVVNTDSRTPGRGFFDLCRDNLGINIGRSEEQELAHWSQEVQRCFDYWRSRPDAS